MGKTQKDSEYSGFYVPASYIMYGTFRISVDFYYVPCGRGGGEGGWRRGGEGGERGGWGVNILEDVRQSSELEFSKVYGG